MNSGCQSVMGDTSTRFSCATHGADARESVLNQITQIVNRTRAPEIGSNVDTLD